MPETTESNGGGRHRRGRGGASALATTGHDDGEPLFTRPPREPIVEPLIDLTGPAGAPEPRSGRTAPPISDLLVEPIGRTSPAPVTAVAGPPATTTELERRGIVASFRRWWRQESLSRAAQKRAYATAEAILRAQAVQETAVPADKGPTPESYAQAVRGVMTLTEERFQSLGLSSERLQDELRGISRTLNELNGLVVAGGLEGVAPVAATAVATLEGRFDTLLGALSEELRRRSEETDRRLSEQLTRQSAELAAMLESAIERIKRSIPQGFEAVKAVIPEEMAVLRQSIPHEMDRIRAMIPEEMDRLRDYQRTELDRILNVAQKQLEVMRASSSAELDHIRAGIPDALRDVLPDELERVREATTREFERVRAEIPDEFEKVRLTIPAEIERLRATIPEALERAVPSSLVEVVTEELERFRRETGEQLDRLRWAIPEQVERAVIARMGAITVADPAQGEDAEPR
jgi:hypothetical protein